jgi:predicted O-methyltransferase YrrM
MNRLRAIWKTFSSFRYPRDLPLVIGAFRHRCYAACPAEIWQVIEPLEGFLRPREAGLIYWAARRWPVAGPVIELGSFAGRSTIIFALAGRFVHAVDAWSPEVPDLSAYNAGQTQADDVFRRFHDNIRRANVEACIRVHRGLTQHIGSTWITPGAILFVDAGHTYADARSDLSAWTPFLMPGGLLLMHDVIFDGFPGVTRAASELLSEGWRVVASADSLVAMRRR